MLPIEVNSAEFTSIAKNEYGEVVESKISDTFSELILSHELFSAKLTLHGGHVLNWQPKGHDEVFWMSKKAQLENGKAIRGGIPICWPWFGPYNDAGNHGFARTSLWQLGSIDINSAGIKVELVLEGEKRSESWTHKFKVTQILMFSNSFSQQLEIENLSNQDFQFSNALHSYFSVSSPENIAIPDLNSAYFDDKIKSIQGCTPSDVFNCVGPIDKIYHHNSSMTMFDKGWKRAIEIKKSNSTQWVLWNPGKDIAAGMSDIHQQGEDEFVCLEAANTNWVIVPKGEKVSLSQEIQVYKL
ncbi:D-hexose-6-phosphate mutarotase [Thalassotalea nanhaiensis]|uniref:Putative glucose-6-phosphate 1-epimerase n=1 Tax=Thalassotalea nanhaiensis TaxID=3065648 RepID=A0ABY9TG26_9GAMM|nr:D-hexose-6-phosphate mutarotase [Colwelliaceae bacterium SQ345]